MVGDLANARHGATSREADSIDCVRFISCMPATHVTRSGGQMGACFDWIWTAVASTHVRGQRVNANTYSFAVFPEAPPVLFDMYLRYVPKFAAACFYVAYKFGGLDTLSAEVAPVCWRVASTFFHSDASDHDALEAMTQMVIWAAHRDWLEGKSWADELLAAAERTYSPRQRFEVAMTFITPANRYVDGTPQEWAHKILRDHSSDMVEHERLQVFAVALEGPEHWQASKAEILAEIGCLRAHYLADLRAGESDLEVMELRVSIIHPLIFVLVNWGEIDDLIAVLGAWYRAGGAAPADANVLAVVPTHGGGAAYLWPGGRWLTGTGDTATHDAVQRAAGVALGSYFRGSDGDHAADAYEEMRFDVADVAAGPVLEAAMAAHYRFDELRLQLHDGWKPRAILMFPSGPEPLQAMLRKSGAVAAPLEISFQRAQPPRPIRRISVWAGGPMHETFEIDALRHVADRSGWSVEVYGSADATRQDLRRFYEDQDADVVWVISHGTHDPFTAGGTGLHLPDGTLVDFDEVRSWTVPDLGRRLLVLNSCSGATAQGRGGLARIGLAQSLVSGGQAVIGHLWPVHWTTGLAYGAALATCLETTSTEAAALMASELLGEPQRLLPFLEERFQSCEELLDRLRRSGEDLTSITNWGCPVLLT